MGRFFFSFSLGFLVIQIDSTLEMDMATLVEFLENFTFFLNSVLSFFDSIKPKELPWQLAIVTSMSCALVVNSWKVLDLLINKT